MLESIPYSVLNQNERAYEIMLLRDQYDNTFTDIAKECDECYQEWAYACAYLEEKYKNILEKYRAGEPVMPTQFIKSIPPFKSKLSKKTVAHVIEMREVEKASYIAIGKELHMTQAKARHTYEWFYHKQVLDLIRALQEKAESREEKEAIWDYYFRGNKTSKKRYDELMRRGEG